MAHRPHAAGKTPSIAPPEMHPLCRECAGVSTLGEPSPRPPETVLRVTDRLHRYAGADMEWCCVCGYRTDAGYYLVSTSGIEIPEFECQPMKTPEEEISRAMARRAERDQKGADDRAWMEDALAKLQAHPVESSSRGARRNARPIFPVQSAPPLTYEEVRMRHDRDEADGARGRKHRDRAWLLESLEQAEKCLALVQAECDHWESLYLRCRPRRGVEVAQLEGRREVERGERSPCLSRAMAMAGIPIDHCSLPLGHPGDHSSADGKCVWDEDGGTVGARSA